MAYYYKDGSGIDSSAYIYVQLQVTRTDYPTYSHFSVKSVAVSDTGSSSFIRGQVTTNQAGNSWTAATGWKNVSYNGTTTLATATFDVTRGASNKTAHIGAYAEGGGTGIYAGGTDYAWLDVTVPKVLAPNAPTGCTATYVSDSQASVSWTNGATDSDHPRDATLVERRDGSNDWAQVASASGTASGYTDNGISPNTQYQYRVRAKNVAGYSAYSTSGSIYTTPAAPSSVTLDKTAATTVQVDVTGTWGYAVTYDIESTYDGGSTWASVATSTSLPYSATVNAGTVQFRVRAVRGSLSSAWALSASLVTICPPLAPTIVQAPANPTAYGDSSVISWTPNHPDGSAQSAAEIKVTNHGGTSTTYSVTTATSYTLTPNATGTWTAQVRTKGLDPSYGEWSQTVSWGVHNPPAVVITSPATDGTDVVALPLNVAWTVTDSTGVSTQRIIIEGDGQILNRTLAGDVRTVALNASDVALENGQTYTIRLRVMGGSGLVTEQTRIFDVAWLAPTPPVLQITEGEGKSATIDVMDTRYTSSGTVLEASSSMMESLTIQGLSVQDGTPTPSAPVAIESVQSVNRISPTPWRIGANYYSVSTGSTLNPTSDGGVTVTQNADGSLTLSITTANRGAVFLTDLLPAGTYLRNVGELAGGDSSTRLSFYRLDKDMKVLAAYNISNGAALASWPSGTSTLSADGYFALALGSTTAGKTLTVSRMFVSEVGAIYPPFDPYGGISVATCGKNMFDTSSLNVLGKASGGKAVASDGTISAVDTANDTRANNTANGSDYICWLDAGTYTVSVDVVSTSSNANSAFVVRKVSDDTALVYHLGATTFSESFADTFTLSGRTQVYFVFKIYDAQIRIQLEVGSPATAYKPYSGSATPIPVTLRSLPDGTHDEWISGETADTHIQRVGEIVIDGVNVKSVSATPATGDGEGVRHQISLLADADTSVSKRPVFYSEAFYPDGNILTSSKFEVGMGLLYPYSSTVNFMVVLPASCTTAALGNDWFAANPVKVLYPLATPVTTTLPHVNLPYVDGSAWVDAEVTPQIEATFRPVDFPDQPTIQSVDVQRVNADGTAWTVATGLTVGGSCIDPLPPLGVPVTYRATSSAASGSTASGEFTETFGGRDWVLNFGNAAQEHVEFIYNPQADLSLAQGGKGYHFADGGAGKGLPVFYPTTDRDYAGTLKFDTILYGDSDKVLDLCDRYPVAWLRDPFGHRWRAHVAPSVSHGVGQIWPVTLSWDAMRFEEAWDG